MQQNLYDTGQQKDIQAVRAHHWWCGRHQRSRARPMTRGTEHLQVKTRLKGKRCVSPGHTTASTTRDKSFLLFLFPCFA